MTGIEVRDGHIFPQKVVQVVEAIRDYSPELDVEWIPTELRTPGQAAFRITHTPPGAKPYTVMHVATEDEFDTRVLMRLIAGDQRNGTLQLSEIEAAEEAAKRVAFQKWQDERDETIDKIRHILRSPKNTYVVDENLVIKDGIPFNAKDY